METAKQKAIREAYADHWDKVKNYVDENGWFNAHQAKYMPPMKDFDDKGNWYRPILISGIENNNGWNPLPTKEFLSHGYYWIKVKHPKTGVEDVFVYHLNEGPGIIGFAYATHYQPIEKPKPPIYSLINQL